jgi:predicted ATPase/DNA-binding SARP family transcriptional activator
MASVPTRFAILGPVESVRDGSAVPLGGPRHRRLLAVLLVRAGAVVGVGELIDALWGAVPPRSAPEMLLVRLSQLRSALRGTGVDLRTQHGGYVLDLGSAELDARLFERLVATGAAALDRGDLDRASADLRSALALWRGPALAEFADAPFAGAEVARLDELRWQAIEHRVTADLGLGRHLELVAELETLVAEHPLRERLWGQLMLALYRAGRQVEALQAYHRLRELMADQLGLDPGVDLRRLHAAILRQDSALELPDPHTGARRDNLPAALTTLVGRRDDVRAVRLLLREHRLVTLTGVGGVGKSRLAVEVAAACLSDLRDGAWLIDLDRLAQPGQALSAVAATLGVRPEPGRPVADTLAEHVGDAEMLLVLDTCDHLIDDVAGTVDGLLRSCARLRVLATSRERLGLTGERVRPVGGLRVPSTGVAGAEAIGRADAVRLLLSRLAAVRPDAELTDATADHLAEICRRLDGLPLALELAANAAAAWGVEHVAARLDDRFRLLTRGSRAAPARHRTLRAMVEWSYHALDAPQRQLFERLATLGDGFTMSDVEAVGGDASTPEVLARLVDKSLVSVVPTDAGEPRYRLLETLRAYAVERNG